MKQMEIDFGPEMKRTSGNKMRSYNDLQYQFMYYNYIMESPHHFPFEIIDSTDSVTYCELKDNYYKNLWSLRRGFKLLLSSRAVIGQRFLSRSPIGWGRHSVRISLKTLLSQTRNERKKFVCINDGINHDLEESKYTYELVDNFYNEFYPNKTHFEL